jgi:hypothetical protein
MALCEVMLTLHPKINEVLKAYERRPGGRPDIDEAACELQALRDYLYGPPDAQGEPSQPTPHDIAWKVLALEVFEVTAGSRHQTPDVQAEIVQISGRLASAFGGSANPQDKLSGMQLANFGAFYKRSWRANDWTYGRLDGIDRAVRIALNPEALQKRYGWRQVKLPDGQVMSASEYVGRYLHALAVTTAEPDIQPFLAERWEADAIHRELAWLDDPQTLPPPVLTQCAAALTRRLQLEALRQEIPEIVRSLALEDDTGSPPSRQVGQPFRAAATAGTGADGRPDPATAEKLVRSNLLGGDTLAMQIGSDRLTGTIGRAVATTHAALTKVGGLRSLAPLFNLIEWPVRVFYWLSSRLSHRSSTVAALEALAYGVGVALILAAGLGKEMPAAVPAFGWALLAGAVAASLLRSLALDGVLVAGVLVLLWQGHRSSFVAVLVVCLLLLWRGGAVLATVLAVGLAAWWSAGASPDAAALLSHELVAWPPVRTFTGVADCGKAETALGQLRQLLWPALGVALLLMFAVLLPLARTAWLGWRQGRRLRRGWHAPLTGLAMALVLAVAGVVAWEPWDCRQAVITSSSAAQGSAAPGVPAGPANGPTAVPTTGPTTPPACQPSATNCPPAPPGITPPDDAGGPGRVVWALMASGTAALLVGGGLLAFGRSSWTRATGSLALLSGLTANGYLIKEVKVGDLFKVEPNVEVRLDRLRQQLSEFGPEHLQTLSGFAPGEAALVPAMEAPLQEVCRRWKAHGAGPRRGLLLVIGSTDRVALGRDARGRYESNVGLARARAEQVRQRLMDCIPGDQLMPLVSGPRDTPQGGEPGSANDRSVVVWAMWSVPAQPGK